MWVKFKLSGLDLRQVEHLIDKAEKVSPSAVHALQRLLRFFCAEARRVFDHHLGQSDDGIEGRAQLMAHARYELRFVLACRLQLAILVLDLIEQAHILDRECCLVGKSRYQFDLLLGKGPLLGTRQC